MGGGNAMGAELTHGAVAAMMSRPPPQQEDDGALALGPLPPRPVVQVYDAPRLAAAGAVVGVASERYLLLLSDGAHSQEALLTASVAMNALVRAGLLRAGSVLRLLDYRVRRDRQRRIIIVLQLEILRTECTLIGSPTIYEVHAAQPKTGYYSDGLGIHGHMISRAEQGVTNIAAYSPGQGLFGSSTAARAERAEKNLPFHGFYGSMLAQNTIYAKMQQISSLNSHQGQRLAVPLGFGCPGNTYGQHRVHPLYEQTPPMYMNGGHVANNEGPAIPIATLNPYLARWTIKGRVTGKTEVRHFGEGKVFSFDLLDAQGGEIRATCFNSLVDQYYDKIVVGNVYLISRGSVKPVLRSKANPLKHEHELILDASTSVESCSGDDGSIPLQQYNFRQITEIENLDSSSTVDLLGVVTSVSPSVTIARKNGSEAHKRTIQLKDMSGRSVPITLWGNFCDVEGQQLHSQWESGLNPILAVKGGRINHFNGQSVGTTSSSQLKINPDIPAAEKLRQWYAAEQEDDVYQTIAQINDENFGTPSTA